MDPRFGLFEGRTSGFLGKRGAKFGICRFYEARIGKCSLNSFPLPPCREFCARDHLPQQLQRA